MRIGFVTVFLLSVFGLSACKDGGCYYTCCLSETDCLSSCKSGVKNAEHCAIQAQNDCAEGDGGYLTRVEWAEVNGAFCENCESSACAPAWWEANQRMETQSTPSDTED